MDRLDKYFQTCSDQGVPPCEGFIEQLASLGIDGTDTAGRVIVLANLVGREHIPTSYAYAKQYLITRLQ